MSIKRTALDKLKTKFDGIDEKVLGRVANFINNRHGLAKKIKD